MVSPEPAQPEPGPGFARGTRLLTPNGYVPVEAFKPGDPIITQLGIRRAVRQTGGAAAHPPVLLRPGAIGPGIPSRPVRLAPGHALLIDGVLVPVRHLVNGASILRENLAASCFLLALERHDVLMAESLPVESTNPAPSAPLASPAQIAAIRGRLDEIARAVDFTEPGD